MNTFNAQTVSRSEFEIVRKASRLFEEASNNWMDRALKAEASLAAANARRTRLEEALQDIEALIVHHDKYPPFHLAQKINLKIAAALS